jgi:phage gpG-like protein
MEISVDVRAAEKDLDDLERKAINLGPPLVEIGEMLVSSNRNTVGQEGRDPLPWDAPAHDYGHPLLYDTGGLVESIHWVLADANTVKIDDPLWYASFQELGTDRIPARHFMYVPPEDLKEIKNILAMHLFGNR